MLNVFEHISTSIPATIIANVANNDNPPVNTGAETVEPLGQHLSSSGAAESILSNIALPIFVFVVLAFSVVLVSRRRFASLLFFLSFAAITGLIVVNAETLFAEDSEPSADTVSGVGNIGVMLGFGVLLPLIAVAVFSYFFVKHNKRMKNSAALDSGKIEEIVDTDGNTSGSTSVTTNDLVSALIERENSIRNQYFQYINSIDLSLKYPLMRDTSHPLIVELNSAMNNAHSMRADDNSSKDTVDKYDEAVKRFEKAFFSAEGTAKKMRLSCMSIAEQKDLMTAQNLLDMVRDNASSPNERQTAYKKVLKIMDDLSMPATEEARLEIESSSDVLRMVEM